MKILFTCNLVPDKQGAYEDYLENLGIYAHGKGGQLVVILSGQPIASVAERLSKASVRWWVIDGWIDDTRNIHPWRIFWPALGIIRNEKPDIVAVHFGNELPTICMILCAKFVMWCKAKWVWYQHQQICDPGSIVSRMLSRIRLLSLLCDHFVPLYEGGKRSLLKRGIPERKISVIYNGVVDYKNGKPKGWFRKELGLGDNQTVIVSVSSLISRKRVDFSIRAFAKAINCYKNIVGNPVLILIGSGGEQKPLEALVETLGLEKCVRFAGQRPDVRECLQDADFLVLSSTAEAMPLAVLESMSAGMPAVVTDAGSAREIIDNGTTGYVFDINDEQGFSDKIAFYMNNPDVRKLHGANARRLWSEKFSMDRMVREHIELYSRLCENKKLTS